MNHNELAELIRSKFIPFAFTCDCAGNHEECSWTMQNDAYANGQHDTALRIAKLIESLGE